MVEYTISTARSVGYAGDTKRVVIRAGDSQSVIDDKLAQLEQDSTFHYKQLHFEGMVALTKAQQEKIRRIFCMRHVYLAMLDERQYKEPYYFSSVAEMLYPELKAAYNRQREMDKPRVFQWKDPRNNYFEKLDERADLSDSQKFLTGFFHAMGQPSSRTAHVFQSVLDQQRVLEQQKQSQSESPYTITDATSLYGCEGVGLKENIRKLHYVHYFSDGKSWRFTDIKSLYESLQEAYDAKFQSEYFKFAKTHYFDGLEKKYGTGENYQQKLYHVLCHVKDKPGKKSRTGELFESVLEMCREKELAKFNYQATLQQAFKQFFHNRFTFDDRFIQKYFSDNILEDKYFGDQSSLSKSFLLDLTHEQSYKDKPFETLGEYLEGLNNGRQLSGINALKASLPFRFLQTRLFLKASVECMKQKKMSGDEARAYISAVLSKIDIREFEKSYHAYTDYLDECLHFNKRLDILQREIKSSGHASTADESEFFSISILNHGLPDEIKSQMVTLLSDFTNGAGFNRAVFNLNYLFDKSALFSKISKVMTSVKKLSPAAVTNFDQAIDFLESFLKGDVLDLVRGGWDSLHSKQVGSEDIRKILAAYRFIKQFGDVARVQDQLERNIKLLAHYLCKQLVSADHGPAAHQKLELLKVVVQEVGVAIDLDHPRKVVQSFTIEELYRVKLASLVSMLCEKGFMTLRVSDDLSEMEFVRVSSVVESMANADAALKVQYDNVKMLYRELCSSPTRSVNSKEGGKSQADTPVSMQGCFRVSSNQSIASLEVAAMSRSHGSESFFKAVGTSASVSPVDNTDSKPVDHSLSETLPFVGSNTSGGALSDSGIESNDAVVNVSQTQVDQCIDYISKGEWESLRISYRAAVESGELSVQARQVICDAIDKATNDLVSAEFGGVDAEKIEHMRELLESDRFNQLAKISKEINQVIEAAKLRCEVLKNINSVNNLFSRAALMLPNVRDAGRAVKRTVVTKRKVVKRSALSDKSSVCSDKSISSLRIRENEILNLARYHAVSGYDADDVSSIVSYESSRSSEKPIRPLVIKPVTKSVNSRMPWNILTLKNCTDLVSESCGLLAKNKNLAAVFSDKEYEMLLSHVEQNDIGLTQLQVLMKDALKNLLLVSIKVSEIPDLPAVDFANRVVKFNEVFSAFNRVLKKEIGYLFGRFQRLRDMVEEDANEMRRRKFMGALQSFYDNCFKSSEFSLEKIMRDLMDEYRADESELASLQAMYNQDCAHLFAKRKNISFQEKERLVVDIEFYFNLFDQCVRDLRMQIKAPALLANDRHMLSLAETVCFNVPDHEHFSVVMAALEGERDVIILAADQASVSELAWLEYKISVYFRLMVKLEKSKVISVHGDDVYYVQQAKANLLCLLSHLKSVLQIDDMHLCVGSTYYANTLTGGRGHTEFYESLLRVEHELKQARVARLSGSAQSQDEQESSPWLSYASFWQYLGGSGAAAAEAGAAPAASM